MYRYRFYLLVLALFLFSASLFAGDIAERGQKLFMENKPAEAVPLLEQASRQAGADEMLFLYLGISYMQLTRYDEALAAFRRGLSAASNYTHLFHFNIGNTFFMQNRNSFALESYTAALDANANYAPAYLNRANVHMRLGDTKSAVSDYGVYLALDPASGQASEIRRLLDLLNSRIAAAQQEEALRQAQKEAEEAARAALMETVAQSLLDAAMDTTNLSAGSTGVEGYDEEFSLED